MWKCSPAGELNYEIKDSTKPCFGVAAVYDNTLFIGASVQDAFGIRESPSVVRFEGLCRKHHIVNTTPL